MADRYWVGGTASWDATAGTKWATTSGGAGGASVPTSADDVFFDANSGTNTVTVAASSSCNNLTFTGFTGTFAGTSPVAVSGNAVIASGMTWTHSGTLQFSGGVTQTLTSNGKTLSSLVQITGAGTTLSLADAMSVTTALTLTQGTFTTNNYNVTASSLVSNSSNTRTINLGSSTVTLSGSGAVVQFSTTTGLTFNAGTSTIVLTSAVSPNLNVAATGLTFYDVSFTGANQTQPQVSGSNTFNNLSIAGRTSAGIKSFVFTGDQTINGTLTLSAGTNATMRSMLQSNTIGTTRTLTCVAVASLTDIDFRDITIAGAAVSGGNLTGTRLGDCKGNSGITFDASKTVYWRNSSGANWGSTTWSLTDGGSYDTGAFPLAQDTAVIGATYPNSGQTVTVNAAYNIGTIDMSARTSNTMTLATGSTAPTIYGNWINGTGTTLSGTGVITFSGRGSQTITSAGKTFTQPFVIDSPGGSVTLQDAFTTNRSIAITLQVVRGTFDANGYNVSLTGALAGVNSANFNTRTIAIGSGTWTIAGSGTPWNITGSAPVITGTGTISLTSASAKTFAGGDIQTYPTLNQGGTGTLTVTGSNKFKGLTNTAIGRIQFTGGTTNIFDSFTISGTSGNLLQLGSTNTTQAILQKGSAWLMGANSTDGGNNTGLSFTAGGGIDYLSVSYINGTVVAPPATSTGNFFFFF